MFLGEEIKESEAVAEKIISEIKQLNEGVGHLVIVTNNVFEDGIIYDETTMKYIGAMGSINEKLAHLADKVIEVVVGIPIIVKDERLSE
jgi:adenosylcobinamide kinase/adenosylcobinamide-phosphate guanylyltransferase